MSEEVDSRVETLTRRAFLRAGGLAAGAALVPLALSAEDSPHVTRPKVAAIFDVCRHRSHANVILENFLSPYFFNGKRVTPCVEVVSFYADQLPDGEFARAASQEFGIPIYRTIDEALCLGGRKLGVDAVLSIAEGGDYPINELGQKEYPRKRFFDEIVAVMQRSQRVVPLFNDKHLSFRWDWAKEMYETTQQLKIPFMAGSSLPLAERRPTLEILHGAEIAEAVAIHGGPAEVYDFHGLELLQSIVESRAMGESGVSRVECLRGDALWKAADEGRWSRSLAQAAMQAEFGDHAPPLGTIPDETRVEPHGLVMTYKDGLKAAVLKFGDTNVRWNFACRMKDRSEIKATRMIVGPWRNRYLFKAFSHAIQQHFVRGQAPYPVERTLLTSGILDAAMRSRRQGNSIATPELEFGYKPMDFRALREMGETWKVINRELPEPRNQFDRTGAG